jgi:hypothetical protein
MSLLYETILSFLPKETCDFVNEQDLDIQLDVLRLCYGGYSKMIDTPVDKNLFSSHISLLLNIFDDDDDDNDNTFLEELVEDFGDNGYVIWKWFHESAQRQINILLIKMYEYSHCVNTVDNSNDSDFDVHIESIIQQIQTNIRMEREAVLLGDLSVESIEVPKSKRCIVDMFEDEMSEVLVFVD